MISKHLKSKYVAPALEKLDQTESLQCDRWIWMLVWSEWLLSMICFSLLSVCQLTLKRVTAACVFPHPSCLSHVRHCFLLVFSVSLSSVVLHILTLLNSPCSHKLLCFLSLPWELVPCHLLKSYKSKQKRPSLSLCVRESLETLLSQG